MTKNTATRAATRRASAKPRLMSTTSLTVLGEDRQCKDERPRESGMVVPLHRSESDHRGQRDGRKLRFVLLTVTEFQISKILRPALEERVGQTRFECSKHAL